jgi:uncharacterized protein
MQDPVSDQQLDCARLSVSGASCWVLSDGKAGDAVQCLGVAQRLGLSPITKTVKPRRVFTWLMPYGPIDPADAPTKPGSPIAPPFPDIAIASGRRSLPYLRAVKKASGGRTLTIYLKDPRTGPGAADLIWVPAHDALRAKNVIVTLTSPHRISRESLVEASRNPAFHTSDSKPIIGVLLGGNSQHHHFTPENIADLTSQLKALASQNFRLAVTPSGRTPPELAEAVKAICQASGGYYWDGNGRNPYHSILALADHLIVTADSVNMLGEAAATGKPIHLFTPEGGHTKISSFVNGLIDHGAVRSLGEHLENWSYSPLDATPAIAVAVADAYVRHKAALAKN